MLEVQAGKLTAREAAERLGITPKHYYRLEEKMLAGAREAARPGKRGRKKKEVDPRLGELEERLRKGERERELQRLRLCELEETNQRLRERASVPAGKKNRRSGRSTGSPRAPLFGGLQAEGPGPGGTGNSGGQSGASAL
jgi:hypothetical protein